MYSRLDFKRSITGHNPRSKSTIPTLRTTIISVADVTQLLLLLLLLLRIHILKIMIYPSRGVIYIFGRGKIYAPTTNNIHNSHNLFFLTKLHFMTEFNPSKSKHSIRVLDKRYVYHVY